MNTKSESVYTHLFPSIAKSEIIDLYPSFTLTVPHTATAIFVNIRAESYSGIHCGVDQAVLDSKNHGGLLLGRVNLVLKFKEHFR